MSAQKTTVTIRFEVTDERALWSDEDFDQHEWLRTGLKQFLKDSKLPIELCGWGLDEGDGMTTLVIGKVVSCTVKADKTPGFIYFARTDGAFKIGRSKTPVKRLASIATGCPYPVEIYRQIEVDDMATAEKWFHDAFQHVRIRPRGEWFKADPVELDTAIRTFAFPPASRGRAKRYSQAELARLEAELG
jgi:hypothetical protein